MSTVESKEKKGTIIHLKPITREGGWLPTGHDGHYKFSNTETALVPGMNLKTNIRNTGLNLDPDIDDEARIEKRMKLQPGTLNRYNDDFWSKYFIKIPKEGKTLNPELNPRDELDLFVLKVNPHVANSKMEIDDSPSATFYLSEAEKEAEVENVKIKVERDAIKKFGQLSTSEMVGVLKIYSLLGGRKEVKITESTPLDLIESTLYNKIKKDPEEFLRIVNDSSKDIRILIEDLINNKILIRNGSKYTIMGEDTIGATLEDTVLYLKSPQNQDVLIALKSKLEATGG